MKKIYLVETSNGFNFATFNKRKAYCEKNNNVYERYCKFYFNIYFINLIYTFYNLNIAFKQK